MVFSAVLKRRPNQKKKRREQHWIINTTKSIELYISSYIYLRRDSFLSLGVILFAYLFGSLSETTQTGSWFETRLSLLKARESSFQTESVVLFFLLKDALIDSLLDKRENLL